ncbi:hypothetical protein [Inquilinus sp. OTU3971]|uniref:hypothetical protein n=1 Tax=Inquilinus sp. OTU3971 TaxID=3043855 RepID=UPI00313AA7DA
MTETTGITVDVRTFAAVNAIDTCSIWNLLSSNRLFRAALRRQCFFVVAPYVRYEALDKLWTRPTTSGLEMQVELRQLLSERRGFTEETVSLEDLQAVASAPEARRLGRGEIAALALARKLRSAVLTEDQRARRAAPKVGVDVAQTTPHLLGWLLYEGELTDGDVPVVIAEHEARIEANRGRLTRFLQMIYYEACRCRLLREGLAS